MRDQVDHNVEVSWVFSSVKHDEKPKSGCTPTDMRELVNTRSHKWGVGNCGTISYLLLSYATAHVKFNLSGLGVRSTPGPATSSQT